MQTNLMIFVSMFILIHPVLSQYNYDLKPDVTFGDHNDRFDVSDLVSYQNKYFRADGSIDYRRNHGKGRHKFLRTAWNLNDKRFLGSERNRKKITQKVMRETEEQLNNLANIILLRMKSKRRAGEDNFAYHDNMESEGGNIRDYNENLERFQNDKDGREPRMDYRRVGTVPDTFNYAFPIEMQVEGYLLQPEDQ